MANMDHGRHISGITVCMVTAYLVLLPNSQFLKRKRKTGEGSKGMSDSKIRVIIINQSGPKNSPGRVDRH